MLFVGVPGVNDRVVKLLVNGLISAGTTIGDPRTELKHLLFVTVGSKPTGINKSQYEVSQETGVDILHLLDEARVTVLEEGLFLPSNRDVLSYGRPVTPSPRGRKAAGKREAKDRRQWSDYRAKVNEWAKGLMNRGAPHPRLGDVAIMKVKEFITAAPSALPVRCPRGCHLCRSLPPRAGAGEDADGGGCSAASESPLGLQLQLEFDHSSLVISGPVPSIDFPVSIDVASVDEQERAPRGQPSLGLHVSHLRY